MSGDISDYRPRMRACLSAFVLAIVTLSMSGCGGDSDPDPSQDVGVDGGMEDVEMTPDGTSGESCDPLPSVSDGLCSVTPGSSSQVLVQGTVLTPDGPIRNATVAYDKSQTNAEISCVGCDCADQPDYENATVVTCPDSVISPGLMNPHDHLGWATYGPYDGGMTRYSHRHEWRTGANGKPSIDSPSGDFSRTSVLHGELRHLMGGATSIAGSTRGTTPQGLMRNLDTPQATGGITSSVYYSTFPLGDADGTMLTGSCDYRWSDSSNALNNSIYLPHISEGIDEAAQNEFSCTSSFEGDARDLIEDRTSIVHGIGMNANDIYAAAKENAQLVWSPRTNIALYGQTAPVTTYEFYGVPIALGTDWTISGSMNMLRELSCAAQLNENRYDNHFTDRELWAMATRNAALSLGVEDRLGSIENGYIADLTIFDARGASNPYRAVIDANNQDVELVMRGGTALYGTEQLVSPLLTTGGDRPNCGSIDVCGESRSICVERDTTGNADGAVTVSDLQDAASSGAYPLAACETENLTEPTCVPQRPGEYDGSTPSNDQDGDGVVNSEDTCPEIFNPARPMSPNQRDTDDDGLGDVCDPCPRDADDNCSSSDWDGDGELNIEDNCPYIPNSNQANADEDELGNPCDPSTTLYKASDGTVPLGNHVEIEDVVVTAINETESGTAIFVQVPSGADRYDGRPYSGAYVFIGDNPVPSRGDLVSFTGRLTDYFGLRRIENLTEFSIESEDAPVPEPVEKSPCEIATGGADADAFTGVLVEVTDVTVTNENPDAPQDFAEFAIGDCEGRTGLRVDDLMHEVMPDPTGGETFGSIIAPLWYSFSNYKLVPRDADDIAAGAAQLSTLSPSNAFLAEGASEQQTIPPLTATLSRTSSDPTTIELNYPDSSMLTGPDTIEVPADTKEATLSLTGVSAGTSPNDTATVEANTSGNQDTKSASVLVYNDSLQRAPESLTFDKQVANTETSVTATIALNMPAASSGTTVDLSTPSDATFSSSTVTVPADSLETTFTIQTGSDTGMKDITATVGGSDVTSALEVTSGPTGQCLVISEYIEGSGTYNKAIELYNCGSSDVDLSSIGFCVVSNQNTSCTMTGSVAGPVLQSGEVYTVCKRNTPNSSEPNDPEPAIYNTCQTEDSALNFSGNDRIVVFEDVNGNSSYDSSTDTVLDQLGRISSPVGGDPWQSVILRRCNLTPYTGGSSFNTADYYDEFSYMPVNLQNYGTAPSPGVTCSSP